VKYVDLANIESITRTNRRDSVAVTIQKQSNANTVDVADQAYQAVEDLERVLPADVKMTKAVDTSDMVRESLRDVREALILGAILAALVVFAFLHEIRGTLIVALAIPTSVVATFLPISLFGFTINMMVLLGLSLCVGILVDDSIVVIENIHRHLERGEQPAAAALNGRSEIGFAAITITLVDVVVFVPVAFMGGVVGQFFFSFGITVAVATLFSLFMSFTLTPMLASRWFRRVEVGREAAAKAGREEEGPKAGWERAARWLNAGPKWAFAAFDRVYDGLSHWYQRLLQRPVRSRYAVRVLLLVGGIALLLAIVGATMKLKLVGAEFMPRTDEAQVSVKIEGPAGTRIEATNALAQQVEEYVSDRQRFPEVRDVQTTVGSFLGGFAGGGTNTGPQYAEVTVILVKKRQRVRSDVQIADVISRELSRYKSAQITVQAYSSEFGGAEAPLQMQIMGRDQEELLRVAREVADAASGTPGVEDVDVSYKPGKPELQVRVDRMKAADLGMSVAQIAAALRDSLTGDTTTKYREGGDEYDIRVRLRDADRANTADVGRVLVGVSSAGLPIRLSDVGTAELASGPTKIERRDRQRMVVVSANMTRDTVLRTAQAQIQAKLNALSAAAGTGGAAQNVETSSARGAERALEVADTPIGQTYVHWGGEAEMFSREMGFLLQALLLSVALVYMLMAALFNSLRDPFVILTQLPLALVGAFVALAMTRNNLSIVTMIGIIMLMGIVGKNAILMVDYTNTLRARGYDREDAVLEAGPTRMRPILMTTIATVFGMLPTALALTQGAEWRSPMAIVVIGGLLLSTVVTLLMIPVMYTVAEDTTDVVLRLYYLAFRHVPWRDTLQYTSRMKYRGET
jgi:HAE1 family hydrophobic/amphiphilic exporter-1